MAASVLSNASIATVGRVLNAAIGLVITALLTRLLSPLGYGAYIALLSYGTLWQIGADFGLYLTLTRLLGKSRAEHEHDIAAVVSLRLSLLGVAFGVALIGVVFFSPIPNPLLPLLCILIGLGFQSLSQLCIGIYQASSRMLPATIGDSLGRFVQLVAIAWIFWADMTQNAVLLAALIFTIGTAIAFGIHWNYLPSRQHFWPKVAWPQWRELVKVSWPLGALLILNTIYFRIDMIMLPLWRSATEVGLYALAYRLIENMLFFPAMFGGLLLPHLSSSSATPSYLKTLLGETLKVILLGASLFTVILLILPEPIIQYIGGSQFMAAVPLVRILTLALLFMCFGNIFGFVLVAQGRNKTLLTLYICLVVFNVAANLIFIPRFGALAAAWITVITEAIATSTSGILVLSYIRPRIEYAWIIKWIGATTISFLVTIYLPISMPGIVRLAVAAILFLALQVLLGTIKKTHFAHLLHHPA